MARALIIIEQVLGAMYVAFLIARLDNSTAPVAIARTDARARPHHIYPFHLLYVSMLLRIHSLTCRVLVDTLRLNNVISICTNDLDRPFFRRFLVTRTNNYFIHYRRLFVENNM